MDCEYFEVKNFSSYQHYSKRNPPWVKLHKGIWTDAGFLELKTDTKLLLLSLFCAASDYENVLKNDVKWLKTIIKIRPFPDITPLFEKGFLIPLLAGSYQDAINSRKTFASKMLVLRVKREELRVKREELKEKETYKEKEISTDNPQPPLPPTLGGNPFLVNGQPAKKKRMPKYDPVLKAKAEEVMGFLNEEVGKNFDAYLANGQPTHGLIAIMGRMKDFGIGVRVCRGLIGRKYREWKGTDMETYLRPATLFGKEKFQTYLGEMPGRKADDDDPALSKV